LILVNKWDLVEKETMSTVIMKKNQRRINAIYRCALFVSALTKQRLLKALEATVKVLKIDNKSLLLNFQ
jgi:GTP-binding protein